MSVRKDISNGYDGRTWVADISYRDWQGLTRRKVARGFSTKHEALKYEAEFKLKVSKSMTMEFESFVSVYMEDVSPRIKPTTLETKRYIIQKLILPEFRAKRLCDISPADVLLWKNRLLLRRDENGRAYSQTYLRTIENQLYAIFNHAVRFYGLQKSPCLATQRMGKSKAKEMKFWTRDEFMRFIEPMKERPIYYYIFQLLYWTGIRCGEMLALTMGDFDLTKRTLRIEKNYQVVKGKAMITTPKTEKGVRTIDLPEFLCEEMQDYFDSLHRPDKNTRLFPVTKSSLHRMMDIGAKEAGVKRIRIHDIRHSSCALLIDLGYSTMQIADRLGHSNATITELYAHLYPSVQKKMAERLNDAFHGGNNEQ